MAAADLCNDLAWVLVPVQRLVVLLSSRWSTCDASLLVRSVGPLTDLVGRWRLAFVLLAAPPPVLLFGH